MTHLNRIIFQQTIEAAKLAAANSPCWLRAIDEAIAQIECNPCITELATGVLITLPSGRTYLANGKCQCDAFNHGIACWHRAAAQLIARHNEAMAASVRFNSSRTTRMQKARPCSPTACAP